MKNNSNFFDAADLFKIPEQLDIPDGLCSTGDFSKKFHVRLEDIISTWLDNKINLYVSLRSEYCRINRYPNKEEYRFDTFDISVGKDFYQHEESLQAATRKFIPCDKSEIKEDTNFKGSSFYKYVYNGYASGFWRLQPTSTTHLATDNYNLKNANELWGETPGEVRVFGRDDKDYLNFNNDIYVSFERFYITNSGCQILRNLFTSNEANKIEKYDPPYNRIAMVLLINEMFSVNGHVTCSNVCTILSANGINVEQTTIKQVLEETSEKRDKPYKNNPKHSKIASCLITIYCKDNDITKKSSRVAQILNDFVRSSPKKWSIVFTTEMAVNLMKLN
ncbi:hypothetical protein ACUN3I_04270 [Hafnia alvei]|uniref:hypothetical protein n=1 Tax=Hafnia alvei TaxID=569 RepID=UPI00404419B2